MNPNTETHIANGALSIKEALDILKERIASDERPQAVELATNVNVSLFVNTLAQDVKGRLITLDAGEICHYEERGYPEGHVLTALAQQGEQDETVILHIRGLYELEDEKKEQIRHLLTYQTVGNDQQKLGGNVRILVTTDHPEIRLPWTYRIRVADPVNTEIRPGEEKFIDPAFTERMSTYQGLLRRLDGKKGKAQQALALELKDMIFGQGARLPEIQAVSVNQKKSRSLKKEKAAPTKKLDR